MHIARAAVVFALLSGGCTLRASAVLPRAAVRGVVTENRLGISTLSTTESDLLGVEHGATADWDLRVRIDGAEHAASRWAAMDCREGECLPSNRRVFSLPSDRDPRVQVRGERVCAPLAAGTSAQREIALELQQGGLRLEFRWLLTGAERERLARR
jgi:hypothetical protein